ncbi:hypothetical protein FHL15_011218 [Xylaria flabelliformis]|uniref:N-acetyltransferase domain-containing protein n=1 Tax=Xylaria flabelliformis TaxID=2512241 RepID=A0A553HIU9_9PEZI|nr:hypothetical protein FHL15_011218 [Xylaria flabelliformis]
MDAFSDKEYTYWWGPIPAMWTWQEERIRRRFADPSTQQFKVVDDADGKIVAWAKWDPPSQMVGLREGFTVYDEPVNAGTGNKNAKETRKGDGEIEAHTLGPPEGSNAALFKTFFDGVAGAEKKFQANEKLVLTHLCTRHNYHGRGIGSALLRSVLDLADKEGLWAYLEATRLAVPAYERLGYKIVDKLEFDRTEAGFDTPSVLHVMLREPQALKR